MAKRLTSLKFPSDPPNEAAWGRLVTRVRGKQPIERKGFPDITVWLEFKQMEQFEAWVASHPVHIAEMGPRDGLSEFRIYGSPADLTYAKLVWGGK